jgi:hypothetical protein
MTRKKSLEHWETKIANYEVTLQVMGPIGKSVIKRGGPREPTAIHGPSDLKFDLSEKAKANS